MYKLQKNCPQMSFPGRREAPNILHSNKMLIPHFKDEIAAMKKGPFLAGIRPYWYFFLDVFCWLQGGSKHITSPIWRVPTAYSIDKSKKQKSVE